MAFLGLNKKQLKQLEFEVVPQRARLQLLRQLRRAVDHQDADAYTAWMNNVVNICRSVLGLPVSIIEQTDFGQYEFVDTGWLRSELEVSMRRPDTGELVETLADLIQEGWLDGDTVNEILSGNGCAIHYEKDMDGDVSVEITPVEEIEIKEEDEIPNIRVLIQRMETALVNGDYSGVLHAGASVFETLAKDVVAIPTVEDKTLASFFERYRKDSKLPKPILDYILETYKRWNKEPLAGHGRLKEPTVTKKQAVILSEMTKAFVRIERQLSDDEVTMVKATKAKVKKPRKPRKAKS
jgi:hypothetical protein